MTVTVEHLALRVGVGDEVHAAAGQRPRDAISFGPDDHEDLIDATAEHLVDDPRDGRLASHRQQQLLHAHPS